MKKKKSKYQAKNSKGVEYRRKVKELDYSSREENKRMVKLVSIIDKLMKIDAGKVKKNEGVLTMKLKRIGETLDFNCIEVDSERATELDEETLNMSMNGSIKVSTFDTKIKLILLGCKDFRDEGLQTHFGCQSPKDLVKKLMTKDEIEKLADFISNLGGLAEDSENELEEIKN